MRQWDQIEQLAAQQQRPGLIYREPEMAVRVIREEFSADYRSVLIDDDGATVEPFFAPGTQFRTDAAEKVFPMVPAGMTNDDIVVDPWLGEGRK